MQSAETSALLTYAPNYPAEVEKFDRSDVVHTGRRVTMSACREACRGEEVAPLRELRSTWEQVEDHPVLPANSGISISSKGYPVVTVTPMVEPEQTTPRPRQYSRDQNLCRPDLVRVKDAGGFWVV